MTRRTGLFLLGGILSLPALAQEPSLLAVRAARLLDVRAGRYVENAVVVVRDGRIESVGTAAPAGATSSLSR